jgi:hypothetical protein
LTNPLPVASGGTGASSNSAAPFALKGANSDITSLSGLTTALSVAQGGTGSTSLTANNVLLGNGTSALQAVAPGSSGNVLTSNGTTWSSSAPAGGPNPLHGDQVFTSSGTFNVPAGVTAVKVTVIAAGGNSGNGITNDYPGGGGGAGGYIVDYVAVTAGGTATVTVGTNAGTRTSSFAGTTTITATGGSNGGNAVSGSRGGYAGASGDSTILGVTNYSGGVYRVSNTRNTIGSTFPFSLTTYSEASGFVYAHGFGVAGTERDTDTSNNSRHNPLGYGAGAGAGGTNSGATTGTTGSNGLVIVEW